MTASYTKSLNKTTTRLEALLKVIVTPVDPPEGFILNYTLLVGDASFSNFQKVGSILFPLGKHPKACFADPGPKGYTEVCSKQSSRFLPYHHEHEN